MSPFKEEQIWVQKWIKVENKTYYVFSTHCALGSLVILLSISLNPHYDTKQQVLLVYYFKYYNKEVLLFSETEKFQKD